MLVRFELGMVRRESYVYFGNVAWAIIGIHVGLVRPRPGLENEITHKNVQKKVKCDPCAISACETNLVCEVVLDHEREYFAFG